MRHYIYLIAAVLVLALAPVVWRTTRSRALVMGQIGCVIWMLATALVLRPELLPSYLAGPAVVALPIAATTLWVGSWRIGKAEAAKRLQAEDPQHAAGGRIQSGGLAGLLRRWRGGEE